jgi:hypothetical protein
MMKAVLCGLWILLIVSHVTAQQVGKADLTVPPKIDASQSPEKTALPDGCKQILPGVMADGVVAEKGDQQREIVLEILNVSSDAPSVGSELEAEVRLRNAGKRSIQIPWSTDPTVIGNTHGVGNLKWEQGYFEVLLRGHQKNDVLLKSLTYALYGSSSSPGSMLTLQAGEWVSASIKFRIEAEYKVGRERWQAGKRQLLVRWRQARRERSFANCSTTTEYFRYDYHQDDLPLNIDVSLADSTKDTNQK